MIFFDQFIALLNGNVVFVAGAVTAILWLVGQVKIRGSLMKSNTVFTGVWPVAAAALGVGFCFLPGVMTGEWGHLVLNGMVSGLMAAVFIKAKVVMRFINKVKKAPDAD